MHRCTSALLLQALALQHQSMHRCMSALLLQALALQHEPSNPLPLIRSTPPVPPHQAARVQSWAWCRCTASRHVKRCVSNYKSSGTKMQMLINHTKVYRTMRDRTVRAVYGAWRGDGRCLCDIGVSNRSYGGEECCSGGEHGMSAFCDTSGCPGEEHDTSTFCNPSSFNNALQNANPFHGKSCHDTDNQSKVADPPTITYTGASPYTTIEHNKALLRRTLMIEHITMDRKHRYIKTVQEYFDSLVVQYYNALGEWEVERCVGVKREIFKVWGMIRKWNDGVG